MDKNYEPQQLEGKWYQAWEKHGYFSHRASGPSYCIMLPPPNVTGSLHMGHGFQQTLMDALIRYHRMCGDNTLWQVGTDHAGISTQIVVERQLEAEKLTRHDLGREAFLDRVWQWKETSGNRITQQMRRLGTSVDWSRERFTMDEGLTSAVQKVFVRLYEDGLIYRGTRLVNWDPVLQSAISDLEVVSEEEAGTLWHLKYPLVDGSGFMIVATTRPETMLGDVAVAVHPEDERYQNLIGKEVELPLTGRRIPVVSDDMVLPDFGSGCVKITPAHDFRDYELAKRHDLPMMNIFTKTAHLNDQAPEAYRGLERYEARKKVLADLESLGLVEKTEAYSLMVPRGEKSQVVIEPFLTEQWFVKIAPLAEPAIKAVESGEIRFIPETWTKTYFQWMHNIQDWCISRQLWWGHRIPAWYDDAGKIYVAENEFQVREKYKLPPNVRLHQDADVLDTWFSSALWPFSTLGWPEKTPELKAFYPTSVLVTGFDIIFFWVARMIMMGLKFTNKVPFKEVYITGLIRDAEGHKMSKSKGNVLDPLDIIDGITLDALVEKRTNHLLLASQKSGIEKQTRHEFPDGISSYGTDALRFTYCALASQGRNIRFDLKRVDGYRNFCNKLWNAARYVVMNTEGDGDDPGDLPIAFSPADHWIRSKLQKVIAESHKHFQQYRFDLLANELYDFVWHEYCDWYLELSKPVLYGQDVKANLKRGAKVTLLSVLETCLRLLHPLMPFITEEIWQKISKLAGIEGETLMLRPYPMTQVDDVDPQVEREFEWIKAVIVGVRTIRSEMNVAPGKRIEILFNKGSADDHFYIEKHRELLMNLAKADSLSILAGEKPPLCATALAGECEILIPLGNLIDKTAESERLTREIGKLEKELLKTTTKLGNPAFTEKAPLEVVEKEQGRAQEMQSAIEKLKGQLEALK